MNDVLPFLAKLSESSVLVIGDIMLDRFVYGEATRLSPESPVPVLNQTHISTMLGGAGNVLSNLRGLGVKAQVIAVCGEDDSAQTLSAMLHDIGVDPAGLISDSARPTICKTRFVAGQHQLLRVDEERICPLTDQLEMQSLAMIQTHLPKTKAIVISDYGKGMITPSLLQSIFKAAKNAKIPVFIDPKGHDYTPYRGADYVTPNRQELALATQSASLKSDEQIITAAKALIQSCGFQAVIATRSEDGLSVIKADDTAPALHIRAQARSVFDVSGAGDTVIACLAAFVAAGATIDQAARIANLAVGIVVGQSGTAPITRDALIKGAMAPSGASSHTPIFTDPAAAEQQVQAWRAVGHKIGFTNGCFDIVHAGHVHYLAAARAQCDHLIVGLNHDASVRLLKGPARPINPQEARAEVLAALAAIDAVVLFGAQNAGDDNTPVALIERLKPDVYFKGGDYTKETLPETKVVESYGGRVEILSFVDGFSTTQTLEKLRANQ